MARIKKFLAIISSAVLSSMSFCSINISALDYVTFYVQQGKYYTQEEVDDMHAVYSIYLDLSSSVSDKKVSENNDLTYIVDTDSELYKYMKDKLGVTKSELDCSYIEYLPEKDSYRIEHAFTEEEKAKFKLMSDEELAAINIKRFAYVGGRFGMYHDKLSFREDDNNPDYINIFDLCENEVKPLPGVNDAIGTGFINASSPGEPVYVEPLTGDLSMDGKVNIVDAVKLAKYNADPTAYPLLTYSQIAADINGDGELTNTDLIALVKMI